LTRVTVEYELEERREPGARVIGGGYRLQFIVPREQVLGERRTEEMHLPGKPIDVRTVQGSVTVPFGGEGNIIRAPIELTMPHEDRKVRWIVGGDVEAVELWNGGWRQCVNFFLKPSGRMRVRVTLDLSDLDNMASPTRLERVPARPKPWLESPPPRRKRPEQVIRFVQGTPAVIAYDKPPGHVPVEEKERFMAEVAKHFEAIEVFVGWRNWWYALWEKEPLRKEIALAIAREAQEWVDAAHRHGVLAALSLSWAAPGCSQWETPLVPDYQGEYFDPDTGQFVKDPQFFDWANPEAAHFAYRAWKDVASLVRDVDFLFFNEPTWRLQPWYRFPMFSRHALASWREFLGDPAARLPAKRYCKPTDRTDNEATVEQWQRWQDWLASLYANMLRVQARAVQDANAGNRRYKGAIWFQNREWVGPNWACDPDKVFAIPEITYVVCEYCTDPQAEIWRLFKYYAHKHGKKLGSFVNFGYYDPQAPDRVRFEGTDEGFARGVRMGVDELVDMIAAYPVEPVLPWSKAYHAARTRIWDEITGPYVSRR
ncbi:MAG: hypothetical protein H5T86_14865, partial [Armatimonadetes bacterium]|nr:hypothetical protein [Armatimonadota bacterium]